MDAGAETADLLVRGVDAALKRALKERAKVYGRSAEAEHRAILAAAVMSAPPANIFRGCQRDAECRQCLPISIAWLRTKRLMYLVDTIVVSDSRKKIEPNSGVAEFFEDATAAGVSLYLSSIRSGNCGAASN